MSKPLISHIGIAVSDLEAAARNFGLITGQKAPDVHEVADQKVKVAIFASAGVEGGRIELVAPSSPDSPVAKFIEKRGEGLHHICIFVDDIHATLSELRAEGVRLIDEKPRRGAEGNLIAFVHPSSMNGVLIELEEKPK
ncbi:MAG: methylmalonyl-CoA epimerase [Candidatus Zixiibacteriota bacterium]